MFQNRLSQTILTLFFLCGTSLTQAQTVGTTYSSSSVEFEAITWMADGTIYSIDYNSGSIHKLTRDGSFSTITTPFTNLAGGGAGPDGNFYFSDINGGRVYRLNAGGTYTFFASGLNQPVGLQLSPDSTFFYVVNYGGSSVSKISYPEGVVSGFVSGQGINGPDGVALMDNGDLLVANYNDNKVHRVTPEGVVSLFGRHPDLGNMGYIVKAKGYYYVPSIQRHKIARFDEEGNVEIFAGSAGQGYIDGPVETARFTSPNGITANAAGDTLLIAENSRIRFIAGLPEPTSIRPALDPAEALAIFPQPFSTKITLEYTSPRNAVTSVKIVDVSGKLCYTTKLPAMGHMLQRHVLALPDLPSGTYVLQLWEAGQLRQAQEVIRQ